MRQNDFLAARGSVVPPIGTKLDAVPIVNYVMPPLDEDILHGYENFVQPPDVPDDEEEELDVSNDDEEGGSQTASSPCAQSDDF
jgi:hypothetical protein